MEHELISHIKGCDRCHVMLKHAQGVRLVAHLVSNKFSQADAHRAVNWVYSRIAELRRSEAQS